MKCLLKIVHSPQSAPARIKCSSIIYGLCFTFEPYLRNKDPIVYISGPSFLGARKPETTIIRLGWRVWHQMQENLTSHISFRPSVEFSLTVTSKIWSISGVKGTSPTHKPQKLAGASNISWNSRRAASKVHVPDSNKKRLTKVIENLQNDTIAESFPNLGKEISI